MAVDYGMALGFPSESLIVALLITQFVGFPATIVVGKLGEKIGPKRGLYVCIGVYALITVFGYFMTAPLHFYLLAVTIGLVQGGAQALSRSYYVSLIPKPRAAQFFGFYNMLGKFAAVLGPALVGLVALATGSSRLSILSLLVLFALGAALLALVNTDKGAQAAREFERKLEAAEAGK
jgi:UMF1 family MFS transporter